MRISHLVYNRVNHALNQGVLTNVTGLRPGSIGVRMQW